MREGRALFLPNYANGVMKRRSIQAIFEKLFVAFAGPEAKPSRFPDDLLLLVSRVCLFGGKEFVSHGVGWGMDVGSKVQKISESFGLFPPFHFVFFTKHNTNWVAPDPHISEYGGRLTHLKSSRDVSNR